MDKLKEKIAIDDGYKFLRIREDEMKNAKRIINKFISNL
jgi:hypothetical protein